MKNRGRIVWDYESSDGSHTAALYERDNCILEVESNGVISPESFNVWFDFLRDYERNNKTKIRLLSIDNRIQHVVPEARALIPKLLAPSSPLCKIATVESNPFFRLLLKLYRIPISGTVRVNIFSTVEKAVAWLGES